jgi:glycine cleavage system H protein
MSNPRNLKYTLEHEWVLVEGDVVAIGITWHAQDLLGDVVYVDLPEVDAEFSAGDAVGEVESVKAVSEIYTPVSGVICEINEDLDGAEDLVNKDPFGDGWMFKVKLDNSDELKGLMDAETYTTFCEAGGD